MFSEIFYFIVFIILVLYVWSALTKNRILFFIAVCFTFFISVLVAGTGIDYHLGNEVTLGVTGDINGTTPTFLNVSPANDKGVWALQWTASILSFSLIFPAGYWIISGRNKKREKEKGRRF